LRLARSKQLKTNKGSVPATPDNKRTSAKAFPAHLPCVTGIAFASLAPSASSPLCAARKEILDNHNLEAVDSGKVENLEAALEQFSGIYDVLSG